MDKKRKETMTSEREVRPSLRIVDSSDHADEFVSADDVESVDEASNPDEALNPDETLNPDEAVTPPNHDLFVHEAITRKMRNPVLDGPLDAAEPGKMPATRFNAKWLLLAGIASFTIAAGAVALWMTSRKPLPITQPPEPAPAAVSSPPEPSATALPSAPMEPAELPPPATSHIEISVRPADATLVLDNDLIGGNRISIDVARDEGRHVVKASAPGHDTFKKVISFANDVYLEIELKKKPGFVRRGAKSNTSQPLSKATSQPDTAPAANQEEEVGMTLGRPGAQRPTKKSIDEKDPYAP